MRRIGTAKHCARERRRPWRAWAALVFVAACGGTTGLENIVGRDNDAAGIDVVSGVDTFAGQDAFAGVDSSAESDPASADGGAYDRTVPGRPPPQDAGAPSATRDAGRRPDSGTPEGSAPPTTLSILRKQSTDCLDFATDASDDRLVPIGCVAQNDCLDIASQGGTCEDVEGGVTHFSGMFTNGDMCTDVLGGATVSEKDICLQTLDALLSSGCMKDLVETTCLCGATDPSLCLAGNEPPTGNLYETYACDFNAARGDAIQGVFTNPMFGAGMANGIAQCAALYNCGCCFGIPPDGGSCAPPPKGP